MRATIVLLGALFFSACDLATSWLPDGGRVQHGCASMEVTVPVKVLNGKGLPYESIEVTATHLGSGDVVSAKTDGNGFVYIVKEELGGGTIRVVATLGAQRQTAEVNMICGECQCSATPSAVTLTLQ